jgi:hypothetical protein
MIRFDELDRLEWWDVARRVNPCITWAEFLRQWDEFQRLKGRTQGELTALAPWLECLQQLVRQVSRNVPRQALGSLAAPVPIAHRCQIEGRWCAADVEIKRLLTAYLVAQHHRFAA